MPLPLTHLVLHLLTIQQQEWKKGGWAQTMGVKIPLVAVDGAVVDEHDGSRPVVLAVL